MTEFRQVNCYSLSSVHSLSVRGPFVAAFAQSHLGDVSPNTQGAKCIDTGKPCERDSSTCGGKTGKCIAFGPGKDMFESTLIIGSRQKDKAMGLWNEGGFRLTGPVSSIHQFVDMTNVTVPYNASYSFFFHEHNKSCPYVSKLLEKVQDAILEHHLTANNLNEKMQSAYRKSHSTETAILKVQSDLLSSLDKGYVTALIMLDLSAAFDTLDHKTMLQRFEYTFGVTGDALSWMSSYLCDRRQVVTTGDHHSEPVIL
ncbi:putative neutral ceramidase C [Apostichopus japonicus]|uniref:Neutral ceramidase n=1 Tax=Stichopus japonicus TaxID=307972 RepID=A0A2G8K4D7_STIJA|nr:putative neutral ceramidase C [Apostichopus japonicus]